MATIDLSTNPTGTPPNDAQEISIRDALGIDRVLGVTDPTLTPVAAAIGTFGYTTETPPRYFKKFGPADTDWVETLTRVQLNEELSNLIDGAPPTLDTLGAIAAALNDDTNLGVNVSTHIGSVGNPHSVDASQIDVDLGTTDPRSTGIAAPLNSIGYAADKSRWIKTGENDTDWEQILTSTNGVFPDSNQYYNEITFFAADDGSVISEHITGELSAGDVPSGSPQEYVFIGGGVTSIGVDAFRFSSLKSITIPNSVTTIGNGAFYSNSSLTSIIIPDSVNSIGNNAFYFNFSLESISLPNNSVFTEIPSNMLNGAPIASITIPDSVTTIESNAFINCSLTSLIIPDSVDIIGPGAFSNNLIESVTLPNNLLFSTIEDSVFANCSLTTVTIPDSVTTIGSNAFDGNSLTSITFGTNVSSIGDSAFANCSLPSITIPDSVTSIGDSAFSNNSIASLTIGNSVASIGRNAFSWSDLTSVTIPASVTSIGREAFANSFNLATLNSYVPLAVFEAEPNILASTSISTIHARSSDSTWPDPPLNTGLSIGGLGNVTVIKDL